MVVQRFERHRMASGSARAVSDTEFFRLWLRDPLAIGGVLPSSEALGRLITSEIGRSSGVVVELGGGTGCVTRHILARGVAPSMLYVFEQNQLLSEHLRDRFPGVNVLNVSAVSMKRALAGVGPEIGAVVSCLPLLSMGRLPRARILKSAFDVLRPGGALYQFTYGRRNPVPDKLMDRLGLRAELIGGIILNWPPARVYRFTRRRSVAVLPVRSAGSAPRRDLP